MERRPIEELEKKIYYTFRDKNIIKTALTHSSYANEQRSKDSALRSNETYEFLGDSVLSVITSEYIFNRYYEKDEGDMTKIRATVVCSKTLSLLAKKIGLGDYIYLGKGIEEQGRTNPKILENSFEALLAAIYLDSGKNKETVAQFLLPLIVPEIEKASVNEMSFDYKTALQQFIQAGAKNDKLTYACVGEEGPDHDKTFEIVAKLNSNIIGRGKGKSKREAEQNAAKEALNLFDIKLS